MTVTFWALSLAFLIFHPIASSPSVLVSDDTLPECPDGCECRQDFRIAECTGADPYLALQILSVHAVESLILSECYISYELWNETLTDISFNHLSSLSLNECNVNCTDLAGCSIFPSLTTLEVSSSSQHALENLDCDVMQHLKHLSQVTSSLESNPVPNCDTSSLRSLDLSDNSLIEFNMQDIQNFHTIKNIDLSRNLLKDIKAPTSALVELTHLNISHNLQLTSLCTQLLRGLPNLMYLDISHTGVFHLSLGLLEHPTLVTLTTHQTNFECDCQTTLRLKNFERKHLFDEISCSVPVSGSRFNIADQSIIENLHCGDEINQVEGSRMELFAGDTVYLDCPLLKSGMVNGYEVIWLSPRKDLLRWVPQPQTCPVSSDRMVIHQSTSDYTYWDDHYTVLNNGTLRIDMFGWRDRGKFICYADNGFNNASSQVYLQLNYHYRNKIYYLSLGWGFGAAACFLGLTLFAKLFQFVLWNYGCCLCCSCCEGQQPPKIKKLAKVVDSIETYRIQQLEKLRENYNLQSWRIRDNCTMQMEKVRENYHTQVKSLKEMKLYGSTQYTGIKDQYADQITRIREYSSGQLDKCHENYIFQRQRLRKFSAQNYLRIRETKQYTQKTLNRVMENMPALYLDLSSCKQGIGDQDLREWQQEMDRREAEMKDILNTDRMLDLDDLGDSESLYFTPAGTPFREVSSNKGTPSRSPEKRGKRGHKRGISNLSSLFPFWWGVSQNQEVETVAIVEPIRQQDDADEPLVAEQGEQSVPLIQQHNQPMDQSQLLSSKIEAYLASDQPIKVDVEQNLHRKHSASNRYKPLKHCHSMHADLLLPSSIAQQRSNESVKQSISLNSLSNGFGELPDPVDKSPNIHFEENIITSQPSTKRPKHGMSLDEISVPLAVQEDDLDENEEFFVEADQQHQGGVMQVVVELNNLQARQHDQHVKQLSDVPDKKVLDEEVHDVPDQKVDDVHDEHGVPDKEVHDVPDVPDKEVHDVHDVPEGEHDVHEKVHDEHGVLDEEVQEDRHDESITESSITDSGINCEDHEFADIARLEVLQNEVVTNMQELPREDETLPARVQQLETCDPSPSQQRDVPIEATQPGS